MSYFTNVRYGKMRLVGRFKSDRQDLRVGDRCVVRTDRGKELGEVLSPLEPLPETVPAESLWDILRRAEPSDLQHAVRLEGESVPRAKEFFREQSRKFNLPMSLVDVDYVFGGERVIFYFTSETRVDFRELVRVLAHEFRARIELKQVGARDEARLVGDAGHCGCGLCCRGHLKDLGGITMDMAKVQKHTADPAKITGRCGKLLCCLRGEYPLYVEARSQMPPKGARVQTARGNGVVVEQSLLLRQVVIENESGVSLKVGLDEIQGPIPRKAAPTPEAEKAKPPAEDVPAPAAPDSPLESAGEATPAPPPPPAPAPETAAAPASGPAPAAGPAASRPAKPQKGRRPYWIRACAASEVPENGSIVVDVGGPAMAVFNLGGKYHVLENSCPHQGGSLGEGKVEGNVVVCPLHQWKFEIPTGRGLSVPGPCARRYSAVVAGGDLFVGI